MKRIVLFAATAAAVFGTIFTAKAQPPDLDFDYLPRPWSRFSIGPLPMRGKAVLRRNVFNIAGEGSDIWDTADNCEFVYQNLDGDGALVARLVSMQNTHEWAKAGVMLRETLVSGARNVAVIVNPEKGVWLQRRRIENGNTDEAFSETLQAPVWLGLQRQGDDIYSFQSRDGKTWKPIGLTILPRLAKSVKIGLAVCSNVPGMPNRCVFDNVTRLDKIPTVTK